jgi:hypothetical protein
MPKPPTSGRKPGVQNIQTRAVRTIINEACAMIGGSQRLAEWIREDPVNEMLYWTKIYPRLLPLTVQGSGLHGEIELTISTREQMLDRLKAHHLPESLFGYDRPVLDGEVKAIEAKPNGDGD